MAARGILKITLFEEVVQSGRFSKKIRPDKSDHENE